MSYIAPLDLYNLLVNTFAGNITIFFFIALVVIAMASAFFRFTNLVFLSVAVLFVVMLGDYAGAWRLLIVVVIGLLVYNIISRLAKR